MARARNIKPKFFTNDELGELSPLTRLLFIGLWTIADFKGCLEYRAKRIKAQLLPYDECNLGEIVSTLDKSGFISIYSVRGQLYIKILKFEAHQNPHKNEREAGSDIPDISEKDNEINEMSKDGINRDKNGSTRADSLFLIPSSCSLLPESLIPEPFQKIAPTSPDAQKKKDEPNPLNLETWQAYRRAYSKRYGTDPIRDAPTNTKIKAIVSGLGIDSPSVAEFFVSHNGGRYVAGMHQIGMLSMDYAKLHTEWATNTRMTQTKALQADKTATNLDSFAPLIAAAKAKEEAERNKNAE